MIKSDCSEDHSRRDARRKVEKQHAVRRAVPALVDKGFHLGAAFTAPVTSGFHRHREVVGSAEGGDKEGDQKRDQTLDLFDQVFALEVSASGDLRLHDLVRLLHQDRDKAKGDRHHHRDFMHRHMDLLEGPHEALQRVCQLCRRGRQGHDRGAQDQKTQSQCHLDGKREALFGHLEEAKLPDHFAGRQKQVEAHGDHKEKEDRLHAPHDIAEGDVGELDHSRQKQRGKQIADPGIHHKECDQVGKCANEFHSGIQPVQG